MASRKIVTILLLFQECPASSLHSIHSAVQLKLNCFGEGCLPGTIIANGTFLGENWYGSLYADSKQLRKEPFLKGVSSGCVVSFFMNSPLHAVTGHNWSWCWQTSICRWANLKQFVWQFLSLICICATLELTAQAEYKSVLLAASGGV